MAYVKTNWKTGDVVTSSKLNNMETGIYDANEASASAFAPDIDNPQNGDVIKYDSTAEKWVNSEEAEFGLVVPLITVDAQNLTITMDMSFADVLEAIESNKCCYAHIDIGAGTLQAFNLDTFVPSDSTSLLEKQFSFTYSSVGTIPGIVTSAQAYKMSIAFTAVGDKLLTVFTADGSTQIIPPPSNP